jgi:hypothetical protein
MCLALKTVKLLIYLQRNKWEYPKNGCPFLTRYYCNALSEGVGEGLPIGILVIEKDRPPLVAASGDVIQGAGKPESKRASHPVVPG